MRRRQSSATWLMLAHMGLVVYASLYPFWPWRWPPGMGLPWLYGLPWPPRFWAFDVEANLLGYIPLGLLGFAAAMRSGWGLRGGLLLGFLPGPLLSLAMETLQFFLPGRVPSLSDWALNSVGSSLGALLGVVVALGERLASGAEEWRRLGDLLKRRYRGWRAVVVAGDAALGRQLGLKPKRRIPFWNGPIEARFLVLELW